jgi:hypothetical protein
LDRAFHVLEDPVRRHLLTTLLEGESGDGVHLRELGIETLDDGQFELDLHHRHLPKLADNGYVEWDRASDTVRQGPEFDEIRAVVDLLRTHEHRLPGDWCRF